MDAQNMAMQACCEVMRPPDHERGNQWSLKRGRRCAPSAEARPKPAITTITLAQTATWEAQ